MQDALLALGLHVTIRTFQESTATAQAAADAIGVELGAIVKSLCFDVDGRPVLVLTAGDWRVDDRKLAAIYGVSRKRVSIADAATTLRATGYEPGGVSPVGLNESMPILIDSTLARFDLVYAAAGSPNAIFPITPDDLIRVTGGQVADVVRQ